MVVHEPLVEWQLLKSTVFRVYLFASGLSNYRSSPSLFPFNVVFVFVLHSLVYKANDYLLNIVIFSCLTFYLYLFTSFFLFERFSVCRCYVCLNGIFSRLVRTLFLVNALKKHTCERVLHYAIVSSSRSSS